MVEFTPGMVGAVDSGCGKIKASRFVTLERVTGAIVNTESSSDFSGDTL